MILSCVPIFAKNLPVVMYRKFRNVPIFKDIPPICPYFLGFRVGKYAMGVGVGRVDSVNQWPVCVIVHTFPKLYAWRHT